MGRVENQPLEEALVHAPTPVLLLKPRGYHIHGTVNQFLAGADVSEILMVNSTAANRPSRQRSVKASSDTPANYERQADFSHRSPT
jgi:hypothetical protein